MSVIRVRGMSTVLCNAVLPTLVNWNCFQIRSSRGYDTPELAPVGGCHSIPTFYRKNYVRWIEAAKRPETRTKRITEAVAQLKNKQRR